MKEFLAKFGTQIGTALAVLGAGLAATLPAEHQVVSAFVLYLGGLLTKSPFAAKAPKE